MDHIDPTGIRNFQPPAIAGEVYAEAKKKSKETEMDTDRELKESEDAFVPSETMKNLPQKKKEAFMAEAKAEIAKLDPDSESFVDDATQKLVNSALKNEYGKKFTKKKEYKQMEAVLTKTIMRDPRYRAIIEEFLGTMLESEGL